MTSVEWLWEELDNLIPYEGITTSQIFIGLLDKAKKMHKQEQEQVYNHAFNYGVNFSHQEISDEEIEKVSATLDYDHISEIVMWEKGARWYREQLKQRQ